MDPWKTSLKEVAALPQGLGMGIDHLEVRGARPGLGHQEVLYREDHLLANVEVRLANQQVQGEVDRSFQAVFDGDDTLVSDPRRHGQPHGGDAGE